MSLGSGIRNKPIPDPGSRGQKAPNPGSRIRNTVIISVPDPHVFGPPGTGTISQRYESGSGSFYHQAKIVRKTLIPTVL
jgi:hypothetical protein